MPIDRDETLRRAEKLVRQGRLDAAIGEYASLVEDQPRDWTSANTLGDLYARLGRPERAAAEYTRIADHFFTEGFLSKAAALYKKVLKIRPADEEAQLRLAEICARQRLLADAKTYLASVARQRRQRGDLRGVDEVLVRLGQLDPSDLEGRRAAARALHNLGDARSAGALLAALAADLAEKGRGDESVAALRQALQIDPSSVATRVRLTRACLDRGDLNGARDALAFEGAGDELELLLARAEVEIRAGRLDVARAIGLRLLETYPTARDRVVELGLASEPSAAERRPEPSAPRMAEGTPTTGTPEGAAPAGGGPAPNRDVNVVLAGGRGRKPETDEAIEIDLTPALGPGPHGTGEEASESSLAPRAGRSLDDVFSDLRDEVARQATLDAATLQYTLGLTYRDAGMIEEAMDVLEAATRSPKHRFEAASLLGRICRERGLVREAVSWFERAADSPASSAEAGHALLYELAETLEMQGDAARALSVLLDLQAVAGDYRDVTTRINRLSRVQT